MNKLFYVLFISSIMLITTPAYANVDMVLTLGGLSEEHDPHKDEIEVLSWSWYANHSKKTRLNRSDKLSKKVTDMAISFTRKQGKSSAALFLACANGTHFPEASLSVIIKDETGGTVEAEYITIKMNNIFISSYSGSSPSNFDEVPMETVTLNFTKFEYVYKTDPSDPVGGNVEHTWKVEKGEK